MNTSRSSDVEYGRDAVVEVLYLVWPLSGRAAAECGRDRVGLVRVYHVLHAFLLRDACRTIFDFVKFIGSSVIGTRSQPGGVEGQTWNGPEGAN